VFRVGGKDEPHEQSEKAVGKDPDQPFCVLSNGVL
jgi:hypothetical protein